MLNCEICNYYKKVDTKKNNICRCEMTGFEFKKSLEDYEMDYPCYDNGYNMDQLNLINPKQTVAAHVILKEDWKFQYKRRHFKPYINGENIPS